MLSNSESEGIQGHFYFFVFAPCFNIRQFIFRDFNWCRSTLFEMSYGWKSHSEAQLIQYDFPLEII